MDKDLLLKYLCMALPYHPVLHFVDKVQQEDEYLYGFRENGGILQINDAYYVDEVKPYLRPMSSMIDEEKKEVRNLLSPKGTAMYENEGIVLPINHYGEYVSYKFMNRTIQYFLKNHFDFMGLIPKGLAIEVTEENNPYESNM